MIALIVAIAAVLAVGALTWLGLWAWRSLRTDVRDLRDDHTQLAAVVSAASSAAEIIRHADAPPIPAQPRHARAAPKMREAARKSNLRLVHSTKMLGLLLAAGVASIGRQVRDHQVAAAGAAASFAAAGLVTLAIVGGGTESPEAESAPSKSSVPPATRHVSPPVVDVIVTGSPKPVVTVTMSAPATPKLDKKATATAVTKSVVSTQPATETAPSETGEQPAPADVREPETGDDEEQPTAEPSAEAPSEDKQGEQLCVNNSIARACLSLEPIFSK